MKTTRAIVGAVVALTWVANVGLVQQAVAKPLKVYILVGQSNMEGPANIKTFDYIGDDPKTCLLYTSPSPRD